MTFIFITYNAEIKIQKIKIYFKQYMSYNMFEFVIVAVAAFVI